MTTVSVIIPAHNAAAYVERAIASVLAQSMDSTEVIVVDDGSTDDTAVRVRAFGQGVRYVWQERQERAVARNTGLTHARGEYVAFLDADDYWYPEKLARQLPIFERVPDVGLVCSWVDTVGQHGKIVGTRGEDIPSATAGADVVAEAGCFDAAVTYIEDWDLWLRIAARHEVACVEERLAAYQLHDRYLPHVFDRHRIQDSQVRVIRRGMELARRVRGSLAIALERRAQARAHWYGALIDFGSDRAGSGQARSLLALETDPSFFGQTEPSAQAVMVGFAAGLFDSSTPYERAFDYLDRTFGQLPTEVRGRLRWRGTVGLLQAAYAFASFSSGSVGEARTMMSRALWCRPSLLANRGVLSVLRPR
jgi:glycosyltransferase involved in cell wall biosynthesis